MNAKGKENQTKVDNSSWSNFKQSENEELQAQLYQLKNSKGSKAVRDIESIAGDQAAIAKNDDVVIQENARLEDEILNRNEAVVEKSPQTNVNEVEKVKTADAPSNSPSNLPAKGVVSQPKKEGVLKSLKNVVKGFAHLYSVESEKLTSPLKFMVRNSGKLLMGICFLLAPALFTWYLFTNVDFIVSKVATQGVTAKVFLTSVFYIGNVFLFYMVLFLVIRFAKMVGREINETAKIGEKLRED